jgi:proline dehydrogenase
MYKIIRKILLALSESERAQSLIVAAPLARRVARRFVPGERLEDVLPVIETMNALGMSATLDHLGESTTSEDEASAAVEAYSGILGALSERNLRSGVSIKQSDLGLVLSEEIAFENARRVVGRAAEVRRFVRIDMEGSDMVERTI